MNRKMVNDELEKVTRFEVIDHRDVANPAGRIVSIMPCNVFIDVQDDGRTLKVFLTSREVLKS